MKYDQHLHVVTESKMDSEPKYKRGSKQESESPITILIQKNQTAFVTFENNHFKNDFSAADTKPNLLLKEPTFIYMAWDRQPKAEDDHFFQVCMCFPFSQLMSLVPTFSIA